MATKLNKPVTRETGVMAEGRPLLVTLEPNDRISFKAKGMGEAKRVSMSLTAACMVAANIGPNKAALGPDPVPEQSAGPSMPPPAGSTPYRVSGSSIYIGEQGPWITEYASGVYVSEALLKLRKA